MHSATYLPPFVHIVFGLAGACFIILPQTCSQSNAATPLVCRRCRSTEHTTVDALSCHFFSCASWCGLLLHQVAHCFPFHDGTGAALAWLQVTDAEYLVCFSSSIPWRGRDASRSPSITCLAGQGWNPHPLNIVFLALQSMSKGKARWLVPAEKQHEGVQKTGKSLGTMTGFLCASERALYLSVLPSPLTHIFFQTVRSTCQEQHFPKGDKSQHAGFWYVAFGMRLPPRKDMGSSSWRSKASTTFWLPWAFRDKCSGDSTHSH